MTQKTDFTQATTHSSAESPGPHAPPFLAIKANDIEVWAAHIPARIRFAVLLRTLVHSTGFRLKQVDFPGNDDAERPGWDGFIEANEGTPWIPEGLSGWEFGVNQGVKGKADSDFEKSVDAIAVAVRAQTTFVFVTPRRWPGKTTWVSDKKKELKWKDVRAYDASDLEQWLEQSPAAQTWFANETRRPSDGVRTLDRCWSDWADVTNPHLSEALFLPAIEIAKQKMLTRFEREPDEPTVLTADSTEEALAFLAQLFKDTVDKRLASFRDRTLVFDKTGVLPRLAASTPKFIAVVHSRDVECELAPFTQSMHTIIVYPRNAVNADPHFTLEPLDPEPFRSALEIMGYDRDRILQYSNESGRSLTVLRRRLSTVPAVRQPQWATDHDTAIKLIPFMFVGAWNANNETDQTALTLLSQRASYELLEKDCQQLSHLNDAPTWSIGNHRGVVAKLDSLLAISGVITASDLKGYFALSKLVLGEDDPCLDLPESERWMAALHGKSREFSTALREGVSESLVLLAVHGNHLFKGRLGFDVEVEVARTVRELLTPFTARKLEANDRDLPTYAEADPEVFLSLLEQDLKNAQPAVIELMRPAGTPPFSICPRTGLILALEGLAWSMETLIRTVLILARLAEVEINDNWSNKPINSLHSIFNAWMPQTTANHDDLLKIIKLLIQKLPKIAWRICIEQIKPGFQFGRDSYKPRWRTDGHGFGELFVQQRPVMDFRCELVSLVLNWENYSRETLCDLI